MEKTKSEKIVLSMKNYQYLGKNELSKLGVNENFTTDMLISTDTYNESELFEEYNKFSMENKRLLELCVVQMCIIGYGNKTFGSIKDGNNIVTIMDVFKKLNIKHGQNINEKFAPNQLTLRRLMRLLRYQVQKFIATNSRPSFLYLKYSEKNPKFMHICFPMGEHVVETKEEALYIYNTYKKLDSMQNTKFAERLQRVLIAREILKPIDLL